MSPEIVRFLRSHEGARLLHEAAALPEDLLARLSRLRRRYPAELAGAVVETLALRRRAAAKFGDAARMLSTPEGLEQSSGDATAQWRADRFPDGATILDLCCGIGGDAMALARRGKILAVDRSPVHAACAAANAAACGVGERVRVACADATRLRLKGDAAFLDPSRRKGGRRVRGPEDYSPPLSFTTEVRRAVPDLAVKVSPVLDDAVIGALGGRAEFVSDRGECKEAVLWFGGLGPDVPRSASVLPAGASIAADPGVRPPRLSSPGGWLFEPDPAVIRAHLIAEVAARFDGRLMDPQIAYLTCDERPDSPYGAAYRILECMPFSVKRLRQRLREMDARVAAVKRRGVPMEPAEIDRQLDATGKRALVVVLTRVSNALTALICESESAEDERK